MVAMSITAPVKQACNLPEHVLNIVIKGKPLIAYLDVRISPRRAPLLEKIDVAFILQTVVKERDI